jgi:hypothetical protein
MHIRAAAAVLPDLPAVELLEEPAVKMRIRVALPEKMPAPEVLRA